MLNKFTVVCYHNWNLVSFQLPLLEWRFLSLKQSFDSSNAIMKNCESCDIQSQDLLSLCNHALFPTAPTKTAVWGTVMCPVNCSSFVFRNHWKSAMPARNTQKPKISLLQPTRVPWMHGQLKAWFSTRC